MFMDSMNTVNIHEHFIIKNLQIQHGCIFVNNTKQPIIASNYRYVRPLMSPILLVYLCNSFTIQYDTASTSKS
jgi:inhibitor of KinA sporulation pathway (predicted exonuclease)